MSKDKTRKSQSSAANNKGLKIAYDLFLKTLAAVFLYFSVSNWFQIVGLFDDKIRIDIMTDEWKFAIVVLSILQPITAIGLWNKLQWSSALWTLAVAVECVMYLAFRKYFGSNDPVLVFHLATAVVALGFAVVFRLRKAEQLPEAKFTVSTD